MSPLLFNSVRTFRKLKSGLQTQVGHCKPSCIDREFVNSHQLGHNKGIIYFSKFPLLRMHLSVFWHVVNLWIQQDFSVTVGMQQKRWIIFTVSIFAPAKLICNNWTSFGQAFSGCTQPSQSLDSLFDRKRIQTQSDHTRQGRQIYLLLRIIVLGICVFHLF